MKQELISKFNEIYGAGGELRTYFAPGRVNLIGEHTDYNGGHVFPCALTIGTYGVFRKRTDCKMRFYSVNFPDAGVLEGDLNDLKPKKEAGWSNYPVGMVWTFIEKGHKIDAGFDMLIYGTIPDASGLSSSASVHMLTAVAIRDLYGIEGVSNIDIALFGQYAENHFNGVNCGIMDQFAISMGKKDNAILLDCKTLEYQYVPLDLGDYSMVIINCNKPRSLQVSKYNERREEVEIALEKLKTVMPGITCLADVTPRQFAQHSGVLSGKILDRAKHVVDECARVAESVEALKKGDIKTFGELLNQSHYSLRDLYEVTGKELDSLTAHSREYEYCIGSRMTGAGFGGCTVSLVRSDKVEEFIDYVAEKYKADIGYDALFYKTSIENGAQEIK